MNNSKSTEYLEFYRNVPAKNHVQNYSQKANDAEILLATSFDSLNYSVELSQSINGFGDGFDASSDEVTEHFS